MTLIPLAIENVFALPIEAEDAHNFRILSFSNPNTFSYDYSIKKGNGGCTSGLIAMIDLPPGNYSFIATSKDITEEQAAGLVEQQRGGGLYKNYSLTGSYAKYGTYSMFTALASFHSAMKAARLTNNCAVIKLNT